MLQEDVTNAGQRAVPLVRGAAVLAAGAALLSCAPSPAGALATLRTPGPAGGAVAADLSAPVVAAAALLAWALVSWLVAATLLTLASRLPGAVGRTTALLTRCLVPRAVRRGLELALGLTVATSGVWASPASAADSGAGAGPPPRPAGVGQAAATPSLDWPVTRPSAPPATPQTSPAGPAPRGEQVVVSAGDTLWALAERSLGEGASDARIAATWPSWWEGNREAIGDDPDLLHPGQALSAPPSLPDR